MLRTSALVLGFCLAACSAPAAPAEAPDSPSEQGNAARALYERGLQLANEGDSVRAEQYLAAALREGHDWEEALPPLMRVCLMGSRLRAALNYASPYLKTHPDAVWLRYLVGTVYLGLGQPLRAREHLLAVDAQSDYHARAQYLLGQTEWEGFGNEAAAAAHFREYLRVDPEGPNAREVAEWLSTHADASSPRAALGPETAPPAPIESAAQAPAEPVSPAPEATP